MKVNTSGVVYRYPLPEGFLLHRFFLVYESKAGKYVEENFDTEQEVRQRKAALRKQDISSQSFTRERAIPANQLRSLATAV